MRKFFLVTSLLYGALVAWPAFAQSAVECLSIESNSSGRGVCLKNRCSYTVEATWCVSGVECGGSHFYKNTWTLRGGACYPVDQGAGRRVNFAGCKGANSIKSTSADGRFSCE